MGRQPGLRHRVRYGSQRQRALGAEDQEGAAEASSPQQLVPHAAAGSTVRAPAVGGLLLLSRRQPGRGRRLIPGGGLATCGRRQEGGVRCWQALPSKSLNETLGFPPDTYRACTRQQRLLHLHAPRPSARHPACKHAADHSPPPPP